jgi:hypothetical protein
MKIISIVDFSIKGLNLNFTTKFSLLVPLNLGGISIIRIELSFKKSSIAPEIHRFRLK